MDTAEHCEDFRHVLTRTTVAGQMKKPFKPAFSLFSKRACINDPVTLLLALAQLVYFHMVF